MSKLIKILAIFIVMIITLQAIAFHAAGTPPSPITGNAVALDGDTIQIDKIKVQLFGISTDEMAMPNGPKARGALDDIIQGKVVTCQKRGVHDKRIVGVCTVPGQGGPVDLAEELLKTGYAVVYRTFTIGKPEAARYASAETEARVTERGLWESPNNPEKTPWPAWVQAIGSILAILVAVYIASNEARRARRIRNQDMTREVADRGLKARSLALALQLPLVEIKAKARRLEPFWKNEAPMLHIAHQFNRLGEGKIEIPAVVSDNVINMHLMGEPGHDVQQMLAIAQQYNRMIDHKVSDLNNARGDFNLDPLFRHINVLKETIDKAIQALDTLFEEGTD